MTTDLIAQAEALSSMIHMGEKITFGQDTAMIDALISRIRELETQNRELALDVLAASGQAQEAYEAQLAAEAKLAEVEKERDDAVVKRAAWELAAKIAAEATVASLKEQVEAMRGAIRGLVPGHRDPDGGCWCPYGHNPDFGHTIACQRARAAHTTENPNG